MFYKMICDRVFIRDSKYNLDLIAELIYCAACVPVDKSSIYHQQLILEFASRLSKFKTFIPETIKIVESKINEIEVDSQKGKTVVGADLIKLPKTEKGTVTFPVTHYIISAL